MRLDIKAFRLIKPIGAIDFYEAGGPITNKSFVQISEIYQKNIKVLLEEKGLMTNKQIAKELEVSRTTISGITKKMVINSQLKKGPPITSAGPKPSSTFYVTS